MNGASLQLLNIPKKAADLKPSKIQKRVFKYSIFLKVKFVVATVTTL